MKAIELRELGEDQLVEQLDNAKEELFNLRFQLATGQLDNPARIREVRHDVARILTVLSERHGRGQGRTPAAADTTGVDQ
ncbi:MAG: 50S ribosomal protein L29 [Actinomycetota bacterium]